MPRSKAAKAAQLTQVESIIFNCNTRQYLKINSEVESITYCFPQAWQYRHSSGRDFQTNLFEWVDDKSLATEIPIVQIEDFICWIHQHTYLIVDRATRTVVI